MRVPDGTYDNRKNYRRETYYEGKLWEWTCVEALAEISNLGKPWGSYPDTPDKQYDKQYDKRVNTGAGNPVIAQIEQMDL